MKPPATHHSTQNTQFHWENPRICATCIHYAGASCRCNLTAFRFPADHDACERYIAKDSN